MKVILIDDEPKILKGLSMLIDWEKEGYEVVKLCNNALEAIDYLKTQEVDLIISDVKMPHMTGIELVKNLRENGFDQTSFLIMSSYSEFEYVKDALKCGCMDYILKPIQVDELLEILRKVKSKSVEKSNNDENKEGLDEKNFTRNIISIVKGKYDDVDLERVGQILELDCEYRYVELEVNEVLISKKFTNLEKRHIQRELYKHCSNFKGDKQIKSCLFDVSGVENRFDIGFIFKVDSEISEIDYFSEMKDYLSDKMGMPILVLVGAVVNNFEDISASYESTVLSMMLQNYDVNREVIFAYDRQKNDSEILLCKKSIDNLVKSIDTNNIEEINENIEVLYKDFIQLKASPDVIKLNINYFLFELVNIAIENNHDVDRERVTEFYNSHTFVLGTKWGSKDHLIKFCLDYVEFLKDCRKKTSNPLICEIEKDIKERYAENITLKELSKKYYVNSAYLGQLFQKSFGVSFKDYLNDCRIDESINLLVKTDMKVYEIAEAVGYKDVDYFISKFISKMGCTPTKYRKNV